MITLDYKSKWKSLWIWRILITWRRGHGRLHSHFPADLSVGIYDKHLEERVVNIIGG